MKVTTEFRDDHQVKMILELDAQEMERAKRRVAREYARRIKIPGFRPGKAPYEVIVRKVGEATIEQEAIDALLDEYYPKAIEEAGIEPYGPGKLEEIVSTDPPVFHLLVPLKVEVDLGDYRNVRLPYEPPEVADKDVDEVLDSYRQMFAVLEPVDRAAEVGDVVYVNVEAYEEGKEDGEPLFADQNHPLLIEEEPHDGEWPYPGFPEAFLGAKAGDKKTLVYTYPDDDEDEALRGKTVVFKAEVTEVKGRSLPELDDDFAKQLGDFDSISKVRELVREDLVRRNQATYDAEYLDKMLDAILEQATLKYPPQAMEREVEERLKEHQRAAEQRGQSWEAYLEAQETDEEGLKEQINKEAEEVVRRRLVLEAIADQEQLEIDEQQVLEDARQNMVQILTYMDKKEARRLARDRRFVQDIVAATAQDALISKAQDFVIALGKGELDEAESADEADSEEAAADASADETAEAKSEAEAPETEAGEEMASGDAASDAETGDGE